MGRWPPFVWAVRPGCPSHHAQGRQGSVSSSTRWSVVQPINNRSDALDVCPKAVLPEQLRLHTRGLSRILWVSILRWHSYEPCFCKTGKIYLNWTVYLPQSSAHHLWLLQFHITTKCWLSALKNWIGETACRKEQKVSSNLCSGALIYCLQNRFVILEILVSACSYLPPWALNH